MSRVWPGLVLTISSAAAILGMAFDSTFNLPSYRERTLHVMATAQAKSPWNLLPDSNTNVKINVHIAAGDNSVSNAVLEQTVSLIKTVSLGVVHKNLGALPLQPAKVLLYGSTDGYVQAVADVFPQSEVTNATGQTAGFTFQSDVVIPLYLYSNQAYLANTLTHELTHVTLNQEALGSVLPTWINEGFAWYNGMTAETLMSPTDEMRLAQILMRGVHLAQQNGELLPLTVGERAVLHHNAQYNVEFFDYLAVKQLITVYGIDKFQTFLRNVHGEGVPGSFRNTFGISIQQYENQFYQSYRGTHEA